ncbi:MAG: hypothetical protein JWM10_1382, partial [Myxococcaceae bacterium]|nr:hypothetical protein [Myxococcaceae bacterium]
ARPRSQTMPAGFPAPMRGRTPARGQLGERPPQFDRAPVSPASPFSPADARARTDASSVPWHSRELRVTPWLVALVLALNLLLTAALVVVLRYLLA